MLCALPDRHRGLPYSYTQKKEQVSISKMRRIKKKAKAEKQGTKEKACSFNKRVVLSIQIK